MVNSTSTNTLGFIVWTLIITAVCWAAQVSASWRELIKAGNSTPLRTALSNSLPTGIFTALGIFALVVVFWAIVTVRIIYKDHQDLVAANKSLHGEISQLTDKTPKCWLTNLGMKPPSSLPSPNLKSGNAVVFFCDQQYEPPLSIMWEFDRPVVSMTPAYFPDARPSHAMTNLDAGGRSAWAFVEMPALLAFQPTMILVYSEDPKLPPMATKVTIKLLSNDKKPIDLVIHASESR